jgi:UPF0755 protein
MAKKKKKFSFVFKIIAVILIVVLLGVFSAAYWFYAKIYSPKVFTGNLKTTYVCIPTGSDLKAVSNILFEKGYILNQSSFEWLAELKQFDKHIYPGRYKLSSKMNQNELVNLLRSGRQEPVQVTFNSIRTKDQLASRIANQIEADSVALLNILNDSVFLKKYHLSVENALCLFIPNTYEFYWNTSAEDFIERMAKEYKNFWTQQRVKQAGQLGLNPIEVSVLASIVQAEQSIHNQEKPVIAGLYLNRLKIGMNLESDPTLVYALGDFSINRVLNIHKEIDSPYNTYKNLGLPPGPINLPEISSIKAVLNCDKNDFLFMCAKEDFSGLHNFAKTYDEHTVNAKKYWAALDKKNILR